MDPVFTGVGVALVTLFDARRQLDADATADLAARLVELGADAIVVAGTTGEADALDDDERLRLFDAVRAAVGDAVVIGGTGAASTHQAARLTARATDTGVDAVIARTPRGLVDPSGYYRELADAAGSTPVLAYHFPAVSPPGIPVEMLPSLPVAGVKDSSGDATRLLATVDSYAGPVWTGQPGLIHLAGALGCAGGILALANVAPELCAAAFAGDADALRKVTPTHLACERDFPRGVKQLVAERFGTSDTVRMG
ncbi:4-hydroxy-tetrahydrodipicolinate synthase [Actinomycetospora succinea]|uniref:4-hydroxy-tetrahydrodipicolinate synthase n=1 Tax=Actinomycetospora succinea TaxID=663603 RepID=A0A4R6VB45_9PSEU|nr:dihydrodipicolinate synthase family protein [Actinomycetospora succinea]TDQ58913.1 4-hydroxy-tetrahydrodipicolinate synthase [Actinomycetospora succinea]